MKGRPPTPVPVLKTRGTFREDRHGDRLEIAAEKPTCPEWLKGEAKKEWNRQIKELVKAGVIAKLDRGLLAAWCDAWAAFGNLSGRIAAIEELLPGADAEHAERLEKQLWRLAIQKERSLATLLKISDRFGFSPAARARLKTRQPEQAPSDKSRFFTAHVS